MYQLTLVLQGGMEANMAALIPILEAITKPGESGAVAGTAGGSITNLKIQVFAFLALVFRTHQVRALQPVLGKMVPLVVSSIGDRSPKIGAAALGAATDLARLLRPSTPQSPAAGTANEPYVKQIYVATAKCLEKSNADQDIREKGIVCLGDILASSASDLDADVQNGLQILKDRLRNENTRLISLMTICKIAESTVSTVSNDIFGPFMQEIAFEVGDYLRKSNKPVQAASFVCLEAILKRQGAALPLEGCRALITNLQSSIANPDIHLSRALNCLSALLAAHAEILPTIQEEVIPTLLQLISTPSQITTTSSESLHRFFVAYVSAGADAQALVKELIGVAGKSGGHLPVLLTASRCIGRVQYCVAQSDSSKAASIVDMVVKQLLVSTSTILSTGVKCLSKVKCRVEAPKPRQLASVCSALERLVAASKRKSHRRLSIFQLIDL